MALPKKLFLKIANRLPNVGIDLTAVLYQAAGMQHGAMITPTKSFPNGT